MMASVKAVVMAGGRGERFWPASTPDRPKQFIDLTGEGTLIQQTITRLAQSIPFRDIFVIVGQAHLALARAQLPQLPARNFIVEPVGRDTAPCVGLAAVWLEKVDPDALMLVVPADHFIPNAEHFWEHADIALDFAARSQGLVTLGIRPDRPETGYGYIEVGDLCDDGPGTVHKALRFVEKPDQALAEQYLATGRFLWNAGLFAWPIRTIRQEIARHLPQLHSGLELLAAAGTHEEMAALLPTVFAELPHISIDYGVMEQSDRVFVLPSDFDWDDLGTWTAVARLQTPDQDGNVVHGHVLAEDCHNMLVRSKGRLVATLGVSDLIVVETDTAVLVCAASRAQDIRRLALKAEEELKLRRGDSQSERRPGPDCESEGIHPVSATVDAAVLQGRKYG